MYACVAEGWNTHTERTGEWDVLRLLCVAGQLSPGIHKGEEEDLEVRRNGSAKFKKITRKCRPVLLVRI